MRVTSRAASRSVWEDVNHEIKTLTRRGYNYRDEAFFILKPHSLHQARIKRFGATCLTKKQAETALLFSAPLQNRDSPIIILNHWLV